MAMKPPAAVGAASEEKSEMKPAKINIKDETVNAVELTEYAINEGIIR